MIIPIPNFIPSSVSSAIDTVVSFPGIVLQEVMHKIICLYYNVPTFKRMYFFTAKDNQENIPSLIVYTTRQAKNIMLFPFLINSYICVLLMIPWSINSGAYHLISTNFEFINFLCLWIGFSAGYYAIPEKTDLDIIKKLTPSEQPNIWSYINNCFITLFSTSRFCLLGIRFICRIIYVLLLTFLVYRLLI